MALGGARRTWIKGAKMRKNIWLMMIAAVLAAGMMFAAGCSNKSDKGDAGGKALGASQGSTESKPPKPITSR